MADNKGVVKMDAEELSRVIVQRKVGFVEHNLLSAEQIMINQRLYELDVIAHKMTMKWGFRRLEDLAPVDLQKKWASQLSKLEDAVIAGNVLLTEELVKGSVRGWQALEKNAIDAGHVPYETLFFEAVTEDGMVYRVVRHPEDVHALTVKAPDDGVIDIASLVRVYHARHQKVFDLDKPSEYKPSGKAMDEDLGF